MPRFFLSTTKWMELVEIKKLATVALDSNDKTFIVYIVFLTSSDLSLEIYPSFRAQIAFLKANKDLTSNLSKYINFANIIFKDLTVKLLEHTRINDYAIDLIKSQQPSYGAIYN